MNVFVYGNRDIEIIDRCIRLLESMGEAVVSDLSVCDLAIAPLLRSKISERELSLPRTGTLVFHPSLLPRHAGADAIKWAFRLKETYSGATWFWASGFLDGGEICEQEVLEINPDETPRDFYNRAVIPSAVNMLGHIITDIKAGHIRRRAQRPEARTYEPRVVTMELKNGSANA